MKIDPLLIKIETANAGKLDYYVTINGNKPEYCQNWLAVISLLQTSFPMVL